MAGQIVFFDENDRVILRGDPSDTLTVTRPGRNLVAYGVYWPANRGNPAFCSVGPVGSKRDIEMDTVMVRFDDEIEITTFKYTDHKADPRWKETFGIEEDK